MNSFFKQVKKIPRNKIVEVRYEELVANPKKQVKNIYEKLNLPGLTEAAPEMDKYLEMQKDYKVNVYKIDKEILDRVKRNWRFTIDLWGYKPPK